MNQSVVPIKASTQEFIEIEDVDHDLVLFTDGSVAMAIGVSAVNFGLLSEKEQDAIIYAYAGLINSLSFPVQIFIRSQHKDVGAYLALLEEQQQKQTNARLAKSIQNYKEFVATTVKEKDVLDKKFYIVIPFSYLELGISTSILFGRKKHTLPYPKTYIFERALVALTPKRDHIMRLLHRLGLKSYQLSNEQLIKLFFSIYNPQTPLPELSSNTVVKLSYQA